MVELTQDKIDVEAATQSVVSPNAGAVVTFLGTTREFTHGRQTVRLSYECYEQMALQELQRLEADARERWPVIVGCTIIHRLGEVDLGQASVVVAVSTPHRVDAFASAQWIMDELKQRVPIWKQEQWADGEKDWVHPGTEADSHEAKPQPPPDGKPLAPDRKVGDA